MRTPKRVKVLYKYKNLGGASKVMKYTVQKDSMIIHFADHTAYIYTNQTAGPLNIAKMKELAHAGKGLGTFIDANVKDRFLRKLR